MNSINSMNRKLVRYLLSTLIFLIATGISTLHATFEREYGQPEFTWEYKKPVRNGDNGVKEPAKFEPGGEHAKFANIILNHLQKRGIYQKFAKRLSLPIERPSDKAIRFQFAGNGCKGCKWRVAEAGDQNMIRIYDRFLDGSIEKRDPGLIVHEIIHLLQWPYRDSTSPSWVIEGMADYFWHREYDNEHLGWFLIKTKERLLELKAKSKEDYSLFITSGYMMGDAKSLHAAGLFTMIADDYIDDFPVLLHQELYDRYVVNQSGNWNLGTLLLGKDAYRNSDLDTFLANRAALNLESAWCEYIARAKAFDPKPYTPLANKSAAGYRAQEKKNRALEKGLPVSLELEPVIKNGLQADDEIARMLAKNKADVQASKNYNCTSKRATVLYYLDFYH